MDNDPGDRTSLCKGAMEPAGVEGTADSLVIRHRCVACAVEKRNRAAAGDSREAMALLAEKSGYRIGPYG